MQTIKLNNGIEMPQIGLGVWQVEDGKVAADAVKKAIEVGYRSIDTAAIYQNETGVGEGIKASGVSREELFITTKVWNADQGYDTTIKALDESLEKLGLDYVDLYLIHWPVPSKDKYIETYKAMEKLYEDGKVKAIGVCNFEVEHLQRLLDECTVKPAVNQVECHPYLGQHELKAFCAEHDIFIESWSPIMQGGAVLEDETIRNIAEKYGKEPAQVVIRWHLQSNAIVIPKSVTPSRIESNFNVFDFELTQDEMNTINNLDRNERKGPHPSDMNRE
ncbi:aldo/keto reductase [Jeotgalibacillus proteolyticus]|uniref:Aldo/keto reductase n=1 Tax=Jeotgalibacillus proteolyticus TaxID=2082395 RepID=A0A2S5G9W1_9BACL|nr:aldo/keto reductase [Jeotgalibacillus proteolyticus]PPA69792.1 aldo/keto reductase [Jeotgalibacillus proteolyticus]